MKANWTNSSFGLMRNAPELYYSVNGSVEYIKDDIYNALKDEYAAQGVDFEKSGIFLQSDDTTSRLAAKGKPDYSVVILTNNGTLLRPSFIANDGAVFDRWNPTDEYQAMLKSEKERIKEQAKGSLSLSRQDSVDVSKFTSSSKEEREKMRQILRRSTSPFALIGKAIKNAPEATIQTFAKGEGRTQSQLLGATANNEGIKKLKESSKNYIDSLKRKK